MPGSRESRRRRFCQVDVFSETPYHGNPVAVVLDGDGLTTTQMQRFAQWMNLSETAFITPPSSPDADYAVRIFDPAREVPFAGHPTLGTCHAWLSAAMDYRKDVVVQECGAGLVTIRHEDGRLAFAAPPLLRSGPVEAELLEHVAAVLNIEIASIVDAEWVANGPMWVAVLLDSADAVLGVRPGTANIELGVVGLYPPGAPCAIEVRAFFPKDGATAEDPVTGSLNASVAAWLLRTGRVEAPYVASQGTALDRTGRVHVSRDTDGTIWVGGATVTCLEGDVHL